MEKFLETPSQKRDVLLRQTTAIDDAIMRISNLPTAELENILTTPSLFAASLKPDGTLISQVNALLTPEERGIVKSFCESTKEYISKLDEEERKRFLATTGKEIFISLLRSFQLKRIAEVCKINYQLTDDPTMKEQIKNVLRCVGVMLGSYASIFRNVFSGSTFQVNEEKLEALRKLNGEVIEVLSPANLAELFVKPAPEKVKKIFWTAMNLYLGAIFIVGGAAVSGLVASAEVSPLFSPITRMVSDAVYSIGLDGLSGNVGRLSFIQDYLSAVNTIRKLVKNGKINKRDGLHLASMILSFLPISSRVPLKQSITPLETGDTLVLRGRDIVVTLKKGEVRIERFGKEILKGKPLHEALEYMRKNVQRKFGKVFGKATSDILGEIRKASWAEQWEKELAEAYYLLSGL